MRASGQPLRRCPFYAGFGAGIVAGLQSLELCLRFFRGRVGKRWFVATATRNAACSAAILLRCLIRVFRR